EYGGSAVYIPNGITPRRVATDAILLEPFGLESFNYVVMVSRLVPHKSAHTLMEAWKLAREQKPELFRTLKLAVVGGSAFTDDYVRQLEALAATDRSIVMTGYQAGETLEALFAGARFAVHPSTSEGLPIAVLEAMSYGKAVIASDIPENLEVVGDYGVSFKTGDVADLAQKIIELVEDPMQAAGLGHVARTYVEDSFNWDDIATEVLAVYRKHTVAPEGLLALR
ncbi:MAG TPA: glycosyltransferase family 4 protein, partial [bacterium]|nr:glycosyltransferase family 4 protein [bacterium]